MVGDMPASNLMGGFKESQSVNYACRVYHVLRHDCDNVHHKKDFELWKRTVYKRQLSKVLDVELTAKRADIYIQYGIVGSSIFSALDYFDPIKCLPHDISLIS